MDKQSLTYKTLKNISYGMIGYVWMFIFSIFITPIIVFRLGVEVYGVYILVLSINSLLGLFDLGISQILVKYIAEYHAVNDEKRLKDLMYSFNVILLVMSVFSLAALTLIGFWASDFFPSQTVTSGYYFYIFFLSGLISFVGGLNSLFVMVPVALQRFDYSTKIGIANLTASNFIMLFLVVSGYGLKEIFLSQLVLAIIFSFVSRHYSLKILPSADLKFAWNWNEVKNAYKFGIATYMSNAANSALTYFDRLLIPVFLGPSALPYYTLPGNLAAKTPGVISTLSGTIFPMISSLNGLQDMEKIRNIYRRVFNLLTVISFSITISIALFADKILRFWLSADFAEKSGTVLMILAVTYYLLSLGGTLNNFLLGLTKTKFLFQISTFMAVINIILLFYLLPKFGVIGAAWAYLVSVLPIIYMFYYVEKRILTMTGRVKDYLKLYSKLAVVAIPFFFICRLAILPFVNGLHGVMIFGPLSVLLFLVIYYFFRFYDEEDLKAINSFLAVILNRLRFAK